MFLFDVIQRHPTKGHPSSSAKSPISSPSLWTCRPLDGISCIHKKSANQGNHGLYNQASLKMSSKCHPGGDCYWVGMYPKIQVCHGQKSRFLGDGRPPTFNDGILIMGPYKPLVLGWWVYPLLYGNNGSLDPIAHMKPLWWWFRLSTHLRNKHFSQMSQVVPGSSNQTYFKEKTPRKRMFIKIILAKHLQHQPAEHPNLLRHPNREERIKGPWKKDVCELQFSIEKWWNSEEMWDNFWKCNEAAGSTKTKHFGAGWRQITHKSKNLSHGSTTIETTYMVKHSNDSNVTVG